jgi:hypothetical protein
LDSVKFKTVKLHPTEFSLDVWIGDSIEYFSELFNKRYGDSKEYYKETLTLNQVMIIDPTDGSECAGERRIVLNLDDFDLVTMVHELFHVVMELSFCSGVEVTRESQEWGACMIDYLFREISDENKYTTVKRTKQIRKK